MALAFDGITKTITITTDVELDVKNLWSRWIDWWLTSDNSKYELAMSQVGGNDIDVGAGTSIPVYIFLLNGWRIRPKEANHTLNVTNAILVVDGGGDPFINTIGSFTVRINYQQPVQAIGVSTGGGGGGLTGTQATQLLKVYQALMLDPTAPVTNTTTQISFDDVIIDLVGNPDISVVGTRQ
jgi:hypothetical protein